jgi:hypothetical protein
MGTHAPRPVHACRDCGHFFVTYDPRFPYGYRTVVLKRRRYPQLDVQKLTGESCQGWKSKKAFPLRQEPNTRRPA